MANQIQIMRGTAANLVTKGNLAAGELGFSTDTFQMHVGSGAANYEFVMHQLFGAQSIIAATADNTPAELTVGEQSVVGRITSGNVAALTGANLWTILTGQAAADVSMNSHKLTSVTDPTGAQDAATKAYVDALVQGLKIHDAVACATTANISLTAEQTLDGILTSTSRVLVKDQTAPEENGIYVSAAGAWARAADMDAAAEVPQSFAFVSGGTTLGSTGWACTVDPDGFVLDTTAMPWAQFSSTGYVTASAGLTKTGNDIAPDGNLEDLNTVGPVDGADYFLAGTAAGALAWETGDTVRTSLGLAIGTDVLAEQTIGIANDNLLEVDGTPLDTEVAVFTANGINGLSKAETMAHLSAGATADFSMNTNKITAVKDPTADQDAATFKWVTDNFASGSAGANTALSNLASVAINLPLLPDAAAADDFGSATLPFKTMFFAGTSGTPGTNNFQLTGASTSGTRTAAFPDKSGYVLITTAASVIDGGAFV